MWFHKACRMTSCYISQSSPFDVNCAWADASLRCGFASVAVSSLASVSDLLASDLCTFSQLELLAWQCSTEVVQMWTLDVDYIGLKFVSQLLSFFQVYSPLFHTLCSPVCFFFPFLNPLLKICPCHISLRESLLPT